MKQLIEGDRLEAILIIDGTVFQSDIDHQECLQEWYRTTGRKSPYDWDCDADTFDSEHEEAMHQTFDMKESHKAYGFDLFDAAGLDWILIAHDKQTLDDNITWAKRYCQENDALLGYFTESCGYIAEVISEIKEAV